MSSAPAPRALYLKLEASEAVVFGLLHMPAAGVPPRSAVLICPPFGWDEICSHRSRRDWAEQLADSGHAALRIDLPGTGDSSGSDADPGLLDAWTEAVSTAIAWLCAESGAPRAAAIGIGLGGVLACRALALGAAIDDLVLWSVPSRGSAFVRELRAFGRMEASRYRTPHELERASTPEGATSAGGFILSADTTRALEELDLAELALPRGDGRRALMLGRDGIGVDERLADHLSDCGIEVSSGPGVGYGTMMVEPQHARPPTAVFAQVDAWLEQARGASARGERHPAGSTTREPVAGDVATLTLPGGVRIRETPIVIEQPFGRMSGVLAEPLDVPAGSLGAVFLNAGAIRRVGPNRMWVDSSRHWAARGVPSLRLDLEGLGDTDGDAARFSEVAELYVPELFDQARAAIDRMEQRCGVHQFALVGLCSGAFWSFHGALRDERVKAAFMLNPRTLFWDASQETLRYLRRGLLLPSSWRLIARGHVAPARIGAVVAQAPRSIGRALTRREGPRERDELALALDALQGAGKRLTFIFSEAEPFHEELERQGRFDQGRRWPSMRLQLIPGRDHTLRPLHSQRRAQQALDAALEDELAAIAEGT